MNIKCVKVNGDEKYLVICKDKKEMYKLRE